MNYAFVNNLAQRAKTSNICFSNSCLFFACSHMKMSSVFYSTQLCDMFAYEVMSLTPTSTSQLKDSLLKRNNTSPAQSTIVVYNFHSLHTQDRFFLFTQNYSTLVKSKFLQKNDSLDSIAELFPAANWLEREIAELHGISFFGKKDLRNLMLQYGDSTAPFQKSFPSIGVREMFYSPIKDTLVQNNLSVQL
jgi:NADH:ubiquinone oxidoreductase subunit C